VRLCRGLKFPLMQPERDHGAPWKYFLAGTSSDVTVNGSCLAYARSLPSMGHSPEARPLFIVPTDLFACLKGALFFLHVLKRKGHADAAVENRVLSPNFFLSSRRSGRTFTFCNQHFQKEYLRARYTNRRSSWLYPMSRVLSNGTFVPSGRGLIVRADPAGVSSAWAFHSPFFFFLKTLDNSNGGGRSIFFFEFHPCPPLPLANKSIRPPCLDVLCCVAFFFLLLGGFF